MACAPLHIGTCAFAILRQVVGRRLIRQEISILIITYNFPCLSHFHTLNNYKKENSPNQIGKEKMQKKLFIHFKGESNFESIFRACLPVLHECYESYTSYAAMLDAYSLASHQDIYIFLVTSLHLHTPLGLFGF